MSRFKNSLEAADFCIQSLAKTGAATLHLIKEDALPEDGYLELAFSSDRDMVSMWVNTSLETLRASGYSELTYNETIAALSEAGHVKATEIMTLPQFASLVGSGDRIYKKDNEFSFVIIGEKLVALIFSSTDWNALSDYYSQYMNPTRH